MQVLGAAVFAELIAEPDTFVAYLSRMLTFSRITFLELPSPKQLSVSSDLLTVHRNDELSSYKLQVCLLLLSLDWCIVKFKLERAVLV